MCIRNLTKLGGYEEAFQLYEERHSYFIEGNRNWYSLHLYYAILNIHAKRYQTAFDLYVKAYSMRKFFIKQTKTMQEQWAIFRYQVNDFTYRISCLLIMLITNIRCNFHPVRSKAHIKDKKLFNKLKKVSYQDAYQLDDLEIIPLEVLWDIALDSL